VFGIALAVNPSLGAIALLWLCAAYAFAFGVSFVALGLSMRGAARWRPLARTMVLAVGATAALGSVARADEEGVPSPTLPCVEPPRGVTPRAPDEDVDRRRRDRAEEELLRFRQPVSGHEFSPNRPSTTDQPGMPVPTP
jgi:hypothetical protein